MTGLGFSGGRVVSRHWNVVLGPQAKESLDVIAILVREQALDESIERFVSKVGGAIETVRIPRLTRNRRLARVVAAETGFAGIGLARSDAADSPHLASIA